MNTTNTIMKNKAIKRYGAFWARNDPEINYGQTGWARFVKSEFDEQCYFTPDGEKRSLLVDTYKICFEDSFRYGLGMDAESKVKNLKKLIDVD